MASSVFCSTSFALSRGVWYNILVDIFKDNLDYLHQYLLRIFIKSFITAHPKNLDMLSLYLATHFGLQIVAPR